MTLLSEVKPDSSVAKYSEEGSRIPKALVSSVALGGDLELLKFGDCGDGGQNLPPLFVSVDHVEHELTSFFLVVKAVNEGEVLGLDVAVDAYGWFVLLRVLRLVVTSVQDTGDRANRIIDVVHAMVSEIMGNPSSID